MIARGRSHVHEWIIGGLVVVWLLMGGSALAEQLNVITETGSHDERALEYLQLAVKSEAPHDSIGVSLPDLLKLPAAIRPISSAAPVVTNPIGSLLDSPRTRSLVLLTCCYRL